MVEMKYVPTTCPYCGTGCGFNLVTVDGHLVGAEPWKRNPVNEGKLCPKGNFSYEFVERDDRLRTPLIKENGEFREATWDEALELITEKFSAYRDDDPDKVAFLSSARCTNEENYLVQKIARQVIGTQNVDHCARLCHGPTVAGLAKSFGSGAMTNSIKDIAEAKCVFVIGSNTLEQHPLIGRRIINAKENGAIIIVADPRYNHTAKLADIYLPLVSGSNIALLNTMMNVIIEENLIDEEFINNRTTGFEEVKKIVADYTPEKTEEITGVPPELVREAARTYATSEASSLIYSMGITQFSTGTNNVMSTANLAMMTGNLGRPGTGVNPLRGQNNVQGACDMGAMPMSYPGYQTVLDENNGKKFAEAWNMDELKTEVGYTVVELMNAAHEGKINALYIMGENPMLSDPYIQNVKESIETIDFVVVQDIFLTETAALADVVLPATSWAEKDGTFTSTERRVQYIRKAIEPLDGVRPDWEILCDVAKRLGSTEFEFNSPQEVFEEIRKVTPQYAGMNKERLDTPEALHWPCPTEDHPGTPILHGEKFSTGDGLGIFSPIEYQKPGEEPDEEYPLILTTGRLIFHWHTGSMTRRSSTLDKEVPTGFVEINPADAKEIGIINGEFVKVATRRGEIEIAARITEDIKEGIIFIPFHFAECAANVLTSSEHLDPVAKMPEFKVSAASVKKME